MIDPELPRRILRSGLQQRLWDGLRVRAWAEPFADWRERLGLSELLRQTPFPVELELTR